MFDARHEYVTKRVSTTEGEVGFNSESEQVPASGSLGASLSFCGTAEGDCRGGIGGWGQDRGSKNKKASNQMAQPKHRLRNL